MATWRLNCRTSERKRGASPGANPIRAKAVAASCSSADRTAGESVAELGIFFGLFSSAAKVSDAALRAPAPVFLRTTATAVVRVGEFFLDMLPRIPQGAIQSKLAKQAEQFETGRQRFDAGDSHPPGRPPDVGDQSLNKCAIATSMMVDATL